MPLQVLPISSLTHSMYVDNLPTASFLQLPEWGRVKAEWEPLSLGWFRDGNLLGTALVLLRSVPWVNRRLAYIPDGPVIDWSGQLTGLPLEDWLAPMIGYLRGVGVFSVKIGPRVPVRRWRADHLREAINGGAARQFLDVAPSTTERDGERLVAQLRAAGWKQPPDRGAGFVDGQPRFLYHVPLQDQSDDELQASFSSLWRRNILKAQRSGIQVHEVGSTEIKAFYDLYCETAQRDGFAPRSIGYFERMWSELQGGRPGRINLYQAHHEGRVLASAIMVVVGTQAFYTYGASTHAGREYRPSNALHWQMIRDAARAGCEVYDMRGISGSFDPDDRLLGLIRFKIGTGGEVVQYAGEWDYDIRPLTAAAFRMALRARQRRQSTSASQAPEA